MELTTAIQEGLLALLCYDNGPKGARLVRALVPWQFYDPFFRDVAEQAEKYLTRYKRAPGEHTLDLFDTLKARRKEHKDLYHQILVSLQQTKDEINPEYVLTRAAEFAEHQRLKTGLTKAVELLQSDKEGSVAEARSALQAASRSSYDAFSPGLLLNDPDQATAFLDDEDDYLQVGIPEFDKYNLGPVRKGLHLFVGLPGRGKTWWGIERLGKQALLRREGVVHVTLEMSEHKIAQRYMQSLFSVSKRREPLKRMRLRRDELGRLTGMKEILIPERPSFQDVGIGRHLRDKVRRHLKRMPRLYVKEFPTGNLSVRGLEGYLDALEGSQGFIPSLLIVDYADIMETDAKNYRFSLDAIFKGLRGIAMERNIRVATFSQGNRESESLGQKVMGGKNLSEAYAKAFTADTIITYNQTEEERQLGLARLYAPKVRGDVSGTRILISQAYAIGQFCMESAIMANDSDYWGQVNKDKGGSDDGD
jgi:replicative DNA helicase